MYAIVKTGGKQYRVERGQKLLVERLEAAEGADVKLEPLLFRSEETVFDKDGLAGVQVTAKVLGHVRGEKLRVFKFKPKRGYKRRTGHRQELTQIEVLDISHGAKAARKAPAKAKAEPQAKEPAPKAAAKAPAAKAPAAKAPAKAKAKAAEPEGKAPAAVKGPAKAKAEPKAKPAPKAKAAAKPKAKDAKGDLKAPAKEDDQDGS
ncbi:MAG TPA: 50S ribosomal protein L21 [Solirubrobacteraceae bacterium]|nr:50S ribosomal protein L21 [Solirubrobacteraceae bacterium]